MAALQSHTDHGSGTETVSDATRCPAVTTAVETFGGGALIKVKVVVYLAASAPIATTYVRSALPSNPNGQKNMFNSEIWFVE